MSFIWPTVPFCLILSVFVQIALAIVEIRPGTLNELECTLYSDMNVRKLYKIPKIYFESFSQFKINQTILMKIYFYCGPYTTIEYYINVFLD